MAVSFLNRNDLSRGLRNNNPGNLIYTNIPWNGKIPYAQNTDWSGSPGNVVRHFEQFYNLYDGIRAMALDAYNDIKEHNYSLVQYINEYAPSSENNTQAYINYVAQDTGINPNESLSNNLTAPILLKLLQAQMEMENGSDASLITVEDIGSSINLMPQLILQEIGIFVMEHSGSLFTGLLITGGIIAAIKLLK